MSPNKTPAPPRDKAAEETAARAKALDDAKLQQVVGLLEAALDRPDGAAAKAMLDQLRPQLIEARLPRRPSLRRAVCLPFEDMLVDANLSGHLVGRIPRAAIQPAWEIFIEKADKAVLDPALANPRDRDAVKTALEHFARVMRNELDDATAFASKGKTLLLRLGGETNYLALDLMVNAVSIAPQIAKLKSSLPPKPIQELKDAQLDALAEILNQILKATPDRVATALFIVMARLEEPWKIAGILEALAMTGRFKSSAGIKEFSSAALVGQVATHVEAVQETVAKTEEAPVEGEPPPSKGAAAASIALEVGDAMQSLTGTREALEKAGSTAQLRDVERARLRLREIVDEKIVTGAATAIVNAVQRGPGAANVGTAPDPQALRDAELRCVALRRSAAFAGLLTLDGDLTENVKKATEGVEKATSDLCGQIRRARLDEAGREAARAHIMGNARLMEILAGPEKAELMLSRGLEAMGEKL